MFLTETAELADVVLPAAAAWCESEGTVTNSERRVQRVRKALDAAGGQPRRPRHHLRPRPPPGHDWGRPDAETIWNEVRSLSPVHAGHELRAARGTRRPAVAVLRRGRIRASCSSTAGCGSGRCAGRACAFQPVEHDPPVDALDDEFPLRLTTGRRLDEYNTGVQTSGYASPLRRGETPRHLARGRRTATACARARSCACARGAARSWCRCASTTALRPGLTFMTLHFPDDVATNLLTIDATDPKSGTAEFKATAIRIERLGGLSAIGHPRSSARADRDERARRRLLGPPTSAGRRRARSARDGTHSRAADGAVAAHLLLPALHAVQARVGWVSRGALNYICRRLTCRRPRPWGVRHLLPPARDHARGRRVVAHVCDDIACRITGGEALCAALERALGPAGAGARRRRTAWMRSPCLGQCERAPAVLVLAAGEAPRAVDAGAGRRRRGDGRRRAARSPPATADTRVGERRCRCALGAAGRRSRGSGCCARIGRVDPDEPRRLPGERRLRRAGPRARAGPGRRDRRGRRLEARGPRRRRVPDRAQVGGGGAGSRPGRTTWSATPTSPSRAPSRTALLMEEDPVRGGRGR